jgi:hypothetical protein
MREGLKKTWFTAALAVTLVAGPHSAWAGLPEVEEPAKKPDWTLAMTVDVRRALERAPASAAITFVQPPSLVHSPGPRRLGPRATKILSGVGGGFVGFFGGAMVGSAFTQHCHCDDPGLSGAVIGAPIGAALGAWLGVWLAGR